MRDRQTSRRLRWNTKLPNRYMRQFAEEEARERFEDRISKQSNRTNSNRIPSTM